MVRNIWARFGRAEVDLFATSENVNCLVFFSLSHSPMSGDALTSSWQRARLYVFPSGEDFASGVMQNQGGESICDSHCSKLAEPAMVSEMLTAAPWRIPLRRDLLSRANAVKWHPSLELWNLSCVDASGSLEGLSALPSRVLPKTGLPAEVSVHAL